MLVVHTVPRELRHNNHDTTTVQQNTTRNHPLHLSHTHARFLSETAPSVPSSNVTEGAGIHVCREGHRKWNSEPSPREQRALRRGESVRVRLRQGVRCVSCRLQGSLLKRATKGLMAMTALHVNGEKPFFSRDELQEPWVCPREPPKTLEELPSL